MSTPKRLAALLLAALFPLSLSGCFFKSVDELYALPKHSEQYYELQKQIDQILVEGASYAAPTSGQNQQSVQLVDLDGDQEDEAVVFIKTSGAKPLKGYIFDRVGDSFQNVAVIEGDGSSFASVEYVQIDGEPGQEIVLGRQISDQVLQSMSVYTLRDKRIVELMSANYTEYTTVDLDASGNTDLFVLRFDTDERTGVAEYYRYINGQMEREPEALLSSGVEVIKRIITGNVDSGVPAVFVAGMYGENNIITDIFALRGGSFMNITTEGASGTSAQTIRNYYVYATDIDSDGVIELPQPKQLPNYITENSSDEVFWIIDWYKLSIDGKKTWQMTTYHNYSGGWYITLPDAWNGQITISRSSEQSGVKGYVFSKWNGPNETPEPIFTLYAFSGDDRNSVAAEDGRFVLGEKGDMTYAASLGTCALARELTQEDLIQMFNFIRVDWNSGEM